MRWSLNTARFSLSSLKLFVAGVPIIGNTASTISEEVAGDLMFGNGVIGLGMVIGALSGDLELGFIPEEDDNLLNAIGPGFSEVPISYSASFFEPTNPAGVYVVSNDTIWIKGTNLDAARDGAVIKRKFKSQGATSWNGNTAIDLASRANDPGSIGSIFAAAGLSF